MNYRFVKRCKKYAAFISIISFLFLGVSCAEKHNHQKNATAKEGLKKEVLYYTCGMHPSVKVSVEDYKKGNINCPICNMRLTPVYKETKEEAKAKERKILFYRNPMNPAITSKVPAKDEMGMDYIPVYESFPEDQEYYGCGMEGSEHVFQMKGAEGMKCPICGMPLKKLTKEEADKLRGVISRVKIPEEELRLAGVRTEPIRKVALFKELRTVGKVAYDPQLAIAQEEYISSLRSFKKIEDGQIDEIKERAKKLVDSSKRKLLLLGLSEEQINKLGERMQVETSLILPEEKMWIYGDIYEYEIGWVKPGQKVKVTTTSLPGETFEGIISSLNPVIDPKTRSLTFRAEVDNHELKLRPEMYVDVLIKSSFLGKDGENEILAVPKNAVLDTGLRKIVWVDQGEGEFEGREVQVGPEATGKIDGLEEKFFPVLSGLSEGEKVVTKANFLIDSQSQITGVSATAYGGALGAEENKAKAPLHQH